MDIQLLVGIAASIILSSVKNPQHKIALKSVMLKIRNTINQVYAQDPDFNS